jgi:hypothetical protein
MLILNQLVWLGVLRLRLDYLRLGQILVRADSGFARDELMAWCKAHRVDDVFGLARNPRLVSELEAGRPAPPPSMPRRVSRPAASRSSCHPRQLEPRAAGERQSRVPRQRRRSALHCHLAAGVR